jgi:hypothetical protein
MKQCLTERGDYVAAESRVNSLSRYWVPDTRCYCNAGLPGVEPKCGRVPML